MTVQQAVDQTNNRLIKAGIPSALIESQILVAHIMGKDRSWVIASPDAQFRTHNFESLVRRRERREPLAYILGWREFFGRRFSVSPDVLIPRHETEVLVELSLSLIKDLESPRVLDIGTGSGCIAITIQLENRSAIVSASDVSEVALEIAQQNAHDLDATVDFKSSDLFENWTGSEFDLIVSNPPYVGADDELPPEVKLHEPSLALFGYQTKDNFDFYRRIAGDAAAHLAPQGFLVVEVGDHQADEVAGIFEQNDWICLERREDLDGMQRSLAFKKA